jgi:purine-nucleoside phosphorylase
MTIEKWEDQNRKINEALGYITNAIAGLSVKMALVAGSGLEGLSEELEMVKSIPFADIPHMKKSGVQGHAGELKIGYFSGIPVIIASGRLHYYEGHSMQEVTFLTRVMARLGVETLVLTNASGGINRDFKAGSMMLISDHLNLMHDNPLRGPLQEQDGPRFPDMHNAYDKDLRDKMQAIASSKGITLHEGVYAALSGPNYETPAEIRMLKILGADAVGMSTVPEVIVARQCGMKVLAVSHIANPAAGMGDGVISHAEVLQAGRAAAAKTMVLLRELIKDLGQLT